jgi:hypothetical protein
MLKKYIEEFFRLFAGQTKTTAHKATAINQAVAFFSPELHSSKHRCSQW